MRYLKFKPRIAFREKVEAPLSGRSVMKNEIAQIC